MSSKTFYSATILSILILTASTTVAQEQQRGDSTAAGRTERIASGDSATGRTSKKSDVHGLLGVTVGTPAGINLVVGLQSSVVGARLSLMDWGVTSGIQFDLLFNVAQTKAVSVDFFACGGSAAIKPIVFAGEATWDYAGFGVDINVYGLFLSGGLSFGSGAFSSPQLIAQGGFVYEFR